MEGGQNNNEQKLSQIVYSWEYPEYIKYHKDIWWYVISLLLLTAFVAWCFFANNPLFAIFLILFYLVTLLHDNRNPEMIDFVLTNEGVKAGRNFNYFRDVDHFFMVYEEFGIKNLYFQFRNPLLGRLVVPLDGQDAVSIRRFLLKYLKEDLEREIEPISDKLRRYLRL
ncbi:MAG: hypothetical protein WC244_00770 [Patescibacteria group bacterium]|jgi:hypothetical protein